MKFTDWLVLIVVVLVLGFLLYIMQDPLLGKLRTLDPKLVAAGVAWLLTYALAQVLPKLGINIDLDADLIPGYLTVAQGIAFAAAGIAGWWKANAGTVMRADHESGNANIPPDSETARAFARGGVVPSGPRAA